MISEKVANLLNEQVNKEFHSAYLYLQFANYYTEKNLDGFANWYRIQAQEERDHAIEFMDYMQQNDLKVTLEAIAKPEAKLDSDLSVLEQGLEHEKYITSTINNIYAAAYDDKDFRTMQFLDSFIREQREEEATASNLVGRMELFGDDPKGLYLLDQEMLKRQYVQSTSEV